MDIEPVIYRYLNIFYTNIELLISNKMELTNIIYDQQNYIMIQYHP